MTLKNFGFVYFNLYIYVRKEIILGSWMWMMKVEAIGKIIIRQFGGIYWEWMIKEKEEEEEEAYKWTGYIAYIEDMVLMLWEENHGMVYIFVCVQLCIMCSERLYIRKLLMPIC